MTLYSLVFYQSGQATGKQERVFADDLEALDAARGLCAKHTIDIYDQDRFEARVKQGDQLPNARDGNRGDALLPAASGRSNDGRGPY
jgi:hypothetical protein